jgi:hypothetical protein
MSAPSLWNSSLPTGMPLHSLMVRLEKALDAAEASANRAAPRRNSWNTRQWDTAAGALDYHWDWVLSGKGPGPA